MCLRTLMHQQTYRKRIKEMLKSRQNGIEIALISIKRYQIHKIPAFQVVGCEILLYGYESRFAPLLKVA